MVPTESFWFLLLGGALCATGAFAGVIAERRRLSLVIRDQAARNSELARRVTEFERHLNEAQADNQALSSSMVTLPDVVRRLVARLPKREIPLRLASALEQFFEPAQILVYQTSGKDQLILTHAKGLPDGVDRNHTIPFGKGRIGHAAQNKSAFEKEDAFSESLFRRSQFETDDPAGVELDMVAPMVHGESTLGVIVIGRPARRFRDDRRMFRLIADLGALALTNQEMLARYENIANRDSLTGLSTKRYLHLKLGELINHAERSHGPLSLIIFDIDHFKKLNDTYGHLAGDEVLKMVASTLRGLLRADDVPARYGGEEFVVLLPGTSKEDAVRTADKIRRAVEACPLPGGIGKRGGPGVTISGGVSSLQIDGRTSQEILSAADQALYLAKERGRNQIVEFKSRYLSDDEQEVDAVAR